MSQKPELYLPRGGNVVLHAFHTDDGTISFSLQLHDRNSSLRDIAEYGLALVEAKPGDIELDLEYEPPALHVGESAMFPIPHGDVEKIKAFLQSTRQEAK